MAQKLNVTLSLTADTSQAKAQVKLLQNELKKLSETGGGKSGTMLGLTKEVNDAIGKVNELRAVLNKATDATTGKIDLSRFNQALAKSGTSLKQYRDSLLALGPQGQKAFTQLATSIANADARILKAHSAVKSMMTTLVNTVRWQVAASAIHTFTGSIQAALGYVQDLDQSLNRIRIVSGQSAQQMADFAAQANKAAQALSTTTTAYTDAALIFFQQGLNGEEVTKRTDTVIKMAQVTGDAVEEVSSYMTAVWNNFDNGSKSLEYYADVIAQLGAKTAASSSEISQGLEKFAAVAETAGLSYEYATSALATVVAATRQSADTVGTSFKTLFARIQDLELGKTLDDGTTLGKYAQALESVGVNIKDVNGDLKDMDTILDELGARWETLGNDVQVAVAQAVGGTRQYNQLMSLMENWDTMKQNVEYAREAEGTVQRQADIYAESWEAAQKRVKAASQEVYSSLIDEKFFITINNVVTKVLKGTSGLIQNLGGVQGVISTLATFILSKFNGEIANGIDNLILKFKNAKQDADSIRAEAVNLATTGLRQASTKESDKIEYEALKSRLDLQLKFIQNSSKMNDIEQATYRYALDNLTVLKDQAVEQKKIAEEKAKIFEYDKQKVINLASTDSDKTGNTFTTDKIIETEANIDKLKAEIAKQETLIAKINQIIDPSSTMQVNGIDATVSYIQMQNSRNNLSEDSPWRKAAADIESYRVSMDKINTDIEKNEKILTQYQQDLEKWQNLDANYAKNIATVFDNLFESQSKAYKLSQKFANETLNFPNKFENTPENKQQIASIIDNFEKDFKDIGKTYEDVFGVDITDQIVSIREELDKVNPDLEKIQNNINQIGIAANSAIDPNRAQDIQNFKKVLTEDYNINETAVESIIKKIQEFAKVSAEASIDVQTFNESVQHVNQEMDKANEKPIQISEKIVSSVQALSSLTMTLNTVSGSMKTLYSSSASELQKMAAAMMMLLNSIKVFNAVTKISAKLIKNETKAKTENAAATVAQEAATKKDTKAKTENIVATTAQDKAQSNLITKLKSLATSTKAVSIVAGAFTVALIAATLATEGFRQSQIKLAQTQKEAANKTLEKAEAEKEELNQQKELYDSYKEALKVYQNTNTGKQDLINTATKVAHAYDLEGTAVAVLTNNYAKLNDELEEAEELRLQQEINNARTRQKATNARIASTTQEKKAEHNSFSALNIFNEPLERFLAGISAGIFDFSTQGKNERSVAAFNQQFGTELLKTDEIGSIIPYFSQDIATFIKEYEALLNSEDVTIRAITTSYEEDYQKALEEIKDERQASVELTIKTNKIEETKSFDDYRKKRDAALRDIENFGEEGQELLSELLLGTSSGKIYENLIKVFEKKPEWEKIFKKLNLDAEKDSTKFINLMSIFPKLTSTDAEQIWEQWKETLEAAQAGDEIDFQTEAIKNGLNDLKEEMSADDWTKFWEDITDLHWSEDFKEEFKSIFTSQDRENYLKDLQNNLTNPVKEYEKSIQGYRDFIEQIQNNIKDIVDEDEASQLAKQITEFEQKIEQNFNKIRSSIRSTFTESKEAIEGYQEELNKIKIGDTISLELVAYLKDIGVENLEKYLSSMGDGTYKLANAAEDFVKIVKNISFKNIVSDYTFSIANFKELQQQFQNISQYTQIANPQYYLNQETLRLEQEQWALTGIKGNYFEQASKNLEFTSPTIDIANPDYQDIEQQLIKIIDQYGIIIDDTIEKYSNEWFNKVEDELNNQLAQQFFNYADSFTNLVDLEEAFQPYLNGQYTKAIDAYSLAWTNLNEQMELTNVDTQKLAEYTEHLLDVADDADQGLISRFLDEDTAKDIAKEVLRMNAGLETLTSNFEKWNDVLQNSSKTSQEYAAALNGLRAAAADLFDVNEDFISSEFLVDPDNLAAFQEAMNGSEEAIDSLKVKLTESIVQGFDITGELKSGLNDAIAAIQQDLATLRIGGEIDPTLLAGLEEAAKEAKLTATEFEALADAMGIDVDYEQQTITGPVQGTRIHHQVRNYETIDDRTGAANYVEDEWSEPVTLDEVEHTVFAFGTNGEKPSIKGATKKATGVMANNSSLNKGGNVSSPKKPVKGDKSQFKTEVERYHEINKVLEDMERKLKRIENVKSKAFGPDKIKAIKDEVGMLNAENKAYEERLREANEYLQMDRAKVLGLGAQLDENGIITNYSQVAASLNNQYNQGYVEYINAQNAAIAAYNQTGNQDAYDKALDAINEKWKEVQRLNKENVDALKQYEDTIKQIEEDEIKLEELKQQKYEAEIEEIEVRVNLKVSLSETQMKRIDFQLKLLGDDIDKATDRILKYGETADAQMLNAGAAEEGIRRVLSHAGADEDLINRYMTSGLTEEDLSGLKLTEKDVELLEGYTDKLISAYGTIMEQQKKVWEEVDKVLQETTDEFEKLDATLERISKRLGSYQNIINTVGKNILDPTGELTRAIATTQIDISKNAALNRKNQLDTYKSQAEDLRKAIAEGTQKGTKEEAENRLKEMEKTISETENLYLEEINNLAEAWKTSFDLANQQIFEDFEKQATGAAGSFEFLNMQYDFAEELADQVVPEYERIYDLSKLTRDITNSINDGKLIAGNEKLAQLQDDITAEMNKQEMSSKYNLDYLRMRYELLLAEMQLEEARNNKTSLKLKRDSQGNYSYQYGVDEDAISAAQQNYEDKLYAMQKFNDDFIQEQQKLLATIPEQMNQALASLDPGDPQYDEKRQAIIDHYQKLYDTVAENLERALGNQRTLYLEDWSAYNKATGYKISSEEKFMDTFEETLLSQTTGYKNLGDLRAAFTEASLRENDALAESHHNYIEGIKHDLEECGLDTEKFSEIVYTALGQANKEIAETGRISDETREKFSAMSTSVIADATKTSDEIELKAKAIAAAAEAAVTSLENFRKKAVELADAVNSIPNSFERNYKLVYDIVTNGEVPDLSELPSSDAKAGADKQTNTDLKENSDYVPIGAYNNSNNYLLLDYYSHANLAQIDAAEGQGAAYTRAAFISKDRNRRVKIVYPYSSYDTGGYTGNWNSSEGRLAMLHQKELVLNASDTSNMLEMVSAVRDLAGAAQANVAGNIAQMIADNIASALYNTTTINNGMQQQVTINADFPAATSAYEIETALNSLVNKATQRAGISQNYR